MSKNVFGIFLFCLFIFTACTKTIDSNNSPSLHGSTVAQQIPNICEVREDATKTAAANRTYAISQTPVVLLIDFNGQQVTNSIWGSDETISCPLVPANLLTSSMKDYIFQSVTEDFIGFSVKVTKSEAEYQAAPVSRRMRCIVTYNMKDRFGNIGGIAFISSMLWGDDTPCFVFCDVLQFNQKYIAGAVSHELGHAFGLHHQARYSEGCTLEEEYHTGFGWDALGWAPIMGLSYYQSMVTWHNGTSSIGCDQLQNDMDVINTIAGIKADDYSANINTSTIQLPVLGIKTGILENAEDKDAFFKKESAAKRIIVSSNGNSDIALEIYNSFGQLISVYDDVSGPGLDVVISGKKYIKVRVSSNQPFVPDGNGFGGYSINVSKP